MSVEYNAMSGRIYGRWEREANDRVIFISNQGRQIRFRYAGTSRQYPSAAEYQCTQCPLKALMINAEFRVVDPCAGHDCSVGACLPQWTPTINDATTAISAQRSPATAALTPRSSRRVKKIPKVIAKAVYDANGFIQWHSGRYPGTTIKFRKAQFLPGSRRRHFSCSLCASKCTKYQRCLKACGISRRYLIVLDDNIINHHPDDEKLKAMLQLMQSRFSESINSLAKAAAEGATCVAEISNGGHTVLTSIRPQVIHGSRANTRPRDDSGRTPLDQRAGAQAGLSRVADSAAGQATAKRTTATRNNESIRRSEDFDLGPAMDALDELLQHAESTYSVSSAPQYAASSGADTPHEGETRVLSATQWVLEGEHKPRRFYGRGEAANVEDSNAPTPVTPNGTSRLIGSAASQATQNRSVGPPDEAKSPTKKSPVVITIDDSDDDSDANSCSSVTSRASRKLAEREPDENNVTERLSKGPAEKFHRFIEEFKLKEEYLDYSINTRGKPRDFLQLPHVTEKWIEFDLRN